jgi:hypothetical protein
MAYIEMNGSLSTAIQSNNTLSQAYLYAMQSMNFYNIVEGLRDAAGSLGDTKIPLFVYYRTSSRVEDVRVRQRLQNGVYLDLTFNNGLFALLRKMFDTEGRIVEVYDRRKMNRNGELNPHVREVVLLVRGRGR